LLDVGGGSVELVLVQQGRPLWLRSLPLGAARLADRFLTSDPPTKRQIQRLEKHLARELGSLLTSARHAGVARVIGTSGTVNTLVAMAAAARGQDLPRLHGARATAREVRRMRRRLLALSVGRRAELPGMDAKRVDLMPAAAVLADFVLARTGAPELMACAWALREGVLLELAGVRRDPVAGAERDRRRAVEALAARFAGENPHGRHVARLALALFDGTAAALGLPAPARELGGPSRDRGRGGRGGGRARAVGGRAPRGPARAATRAAGRAAPRAQRRRRAPPSARERDIMSMVRGRPSALAEPHPYPGRLITVEGIDGSGKSTQLLLLDRWLTARGFPVRFTEGNSSRLVRRAMKRGKRKDLLTPTTFSLLHAVDF